MIEANSPQESHANDEYGRENKIPILKGPMSSCCSCPSVYTTGVKQKIATCPGHLWIKYECRQLKKNVSQIIITKTHCILSV